MIVFLQASIVSCVGHCTGVDMAMAFDKAMEAPAGEGD